MAKIGRPGIEGQNVLVKLPNQLLADLDEVWRRVGSGSRNDFIRRAVADEVLRIKSKLSEVMAE